MQNLPKHPFNVKKSLTVALVTTLTALSGASVAQIIKNDGQLPQDNSGEAKRESGATAENNSAKSKKVELKDLSHDELFKLLSHDDYKTRNEAHKYIWKQGVGIIPQLEKAVLSDDPEISLRSADILRNLRIGVTHDTPKQIADKIAEFQTAQLDKQEDILRFLFQEKAYNHMVYMLAEMKNREHALKLHKDFKDLSQKAAREEINNGNIKGAIELLKMSPQTPAVRRSLAFIYHRSGMAEAELQLLSKQLERGGADKKWMLMLLQELNDRDKLREFAHQHGYRNTIAVLDLLEGNPKNLVANMGRKTTSIQGMGVSVINQIYDGVSPQAQAVNHTKLLEEGLKYRRLKKFSPMHILYLTGGEKLGERILLKSAPTKAMHLFNELERPVEALAAIGLTNKASIVKWRDPIIARMLDKKNDDERDWRREREPNFVNDEEHLLDVVNIYWSRGEHDKAKLIMDPLLEALYKQDKDQWANIVADLPRFTMHQLAMHYILKQANDEDITRMISTLYDNTESIDLVWKTLLKQANKNVKQSFQDLSVLVGMYRGKVQVRDGIENYLLKTAKQQGLEDLQNMYLALYHIADYRYDSLNTKKYLNLVMQKKDTKEMQRARIQDKLTAASLNLDWKELTETFKKHQTIGAKSAEWLTVRSIAERELGNIAEADALLDRAMLMTVGLPDEIQDVLSELIIAGDMKRANDILERNLLIQSESISAFSFYSSIGMLASENSYYLMSEQWQKASAMAYAANAITVTYIRDEILESRQLLNMMKMNFTLNFARGMYFSEKGEHQKAKHLLENANECILGDGVLADLFYPTLRKTPYKQEYAKWVKKSHDHLNSSVTDFPNSANTRNTLAWVLSRSLTSLDEGILHSKKALELAPNEAAYLDTMAELWFAKGNRDKAVKWGELAVKSCKNGRLVSRASEYSTKARTLSLYNQLKRFKTEPLIK